MRLPYGIKLFDIVALVIALAVVGGLSLHAYTGVEAGSQVRIESPEGTYVYPLDSDIDLAVDGPLGATHVHIDRGNVHVSESPCRDKICIAAGTVSRAGEWIACLPNKVFVKIEGERSGSVDAQTF